MPASSPRRVLSALLLATALSSCASTTLTSSHAALACADQAYVTNSYGGSVSIIDMTSNTVAATVPVGAGPVNPTISPDGARIYVASGEDAAISVIDARTRSVVATLPAGAPRPTGLAFTPDGQRLVISYFGQVHEPAPAEARTPNETPSATSMGNRSIAIPEEGRVLTLFGRETETPGAVRIMMLATGALSAPIAVGSGPERLVLTPDGQRAYVANLHSGTVSVIDLDRREVIATIPTGVAGPFNLLVTPDGARVFVGNALSNVISVIDTATNRIAHAIETQDGPNGMAFSPGHNRLYVTNFAARSIQSVDLATYAVSSPVQTPEPPGFIRVRADAQQAYYVSPFGSAITVLNLPDMSVATSIEVGRGPSVIAVCGAP